MKTTVHNTALILTLSLSSLLAIPAHAAAFIKLDGVKGESTKVDAESAQAKPQGTTYGPVITIKPKGMHEDQADCKRVLNGSATDPQKGIEERKKCYSSH